MRIFWSITGILLIGLLGVSAAGTHLVQNQPLRLNVVTVTPELVQFHANTPISKAVLKGEELGVETYGADVYLQPEEYFMPGETYSFTFESITNRFGTTTANVPVSFTVPNTLEYFISNRAQLGQYNLQTGTTQMLTPEGFLVNEYVVAGKDVYLLGIPKEQQSDEIWDILKVQNLYKWESEHQRLREVLSAKKWGMQGVTASPDGKLISLYRSPSESYMVPSLWLYDTDSDRWESYWSDSFGAGNKVHFSPDNAWLLSIDLSTNGYSLAPILEGSDIIPIGNYFENLGISSSGRYILFKTFTDEDVFNGAVEFVLFDNNGESENILLDPSITPELISFDPIDEVLWFTYTDSQNITQIGRYDIKTKSTQNIIEFTEDQNIITLKKSKYTDILLYGVKEQNIQLDQNEGIANLIDSFFSKENTSIFRVFDYDLALQQGGSIFEGMILDQ